MLAYWYKEQGQSEVVANSQGYIDRTKGVSLVMDHEHLDISCVAKYHARGVVFAMPEDIDPQQLTTTPAAASYNYAPTLATNFGPPLNTRTVPQLLRRVLRANSAMAPFTWATSPGEVFATIQDLLEGTSVSLAVGNSRRLLMDFRPTATGWQPSQAQPHRLQHMHTTQQQLSTASPACSGVEWRVIIRTKTLAWCVWTPYGLATTERTVHHHGPWGEYSSATATAPLVGHVSLATWRSGDGNEARAHVSS